MITVHHLNNSRSQRVLWLLEELGVPYEIRKYERNRKTMLAPPELREVHPLGKSPVITDGDVTVAESGAILEYLVERYDDGRLAPARGTPERLRWTYWMHFAEGSAMPPLLIKLICDKVASAPMPFFAKPIAKGLCEKVQATLIDPNLKNALDFIEDHLAKNAWFAGPDLSMADFQMSFAIEALLSRSGAGNRYPHIDAYHKRMRARPAYQRAEAKGGPTLMAT